MSELVQFLQLVLNWRGGKGIRSSSICRFEAWCRGLNFIGNKFFGKGLKADETGFRLNKSC